MVLAASGRRPLNDLSKKVRVSVFWIGTKLPVKEYLFQSVPIEKLFNLFPRLLILNRREVPPLVALALKEKVYLLELSSSTTGI